MSKRRCAWAKTLSSGTFGGTYEAKRDWMEKYRKSSDAAHKHAKPQKRRISIEVSTIKPVGTLPTDRSLCLEQPLRSQVSRITQHGP
jgi:hypothetical protein